MEGLNNKAKVTMRKSYGFRTFRFLELALYHSLGKLPEPESVAVGMPVSQHPPHRSPRAALPHEAPISDEWRQSELGGTDEEYAVDGIHRPASLLIRAQVRLRFPPRWINRLLQSRIDPRAKCRTDCRVFPGTAW